MAIVKDRMAYQDFETARDAQERVIEQGWTKRTRTDSKKAKKKKDRDRARDKAKESGGVVPGGGDDPTKQPISHDLLEAVEKRNRLVEAFQPFFEEEDKGRYYGLPERSVYEGLEELERDEGDVDAVPAGVSLQQ
jgi:transcriptional adapter 3